MGLKEKAAAARNILIKTGVSPTCIFARYKGKNFVDGFSKFEAMRQTLTGSPSEQVVTYLTQRLSAPQYNFMRDKRSPFEYGSDLILGWILEDCMVDFLVKSGIKAALAGCDKSRDFLCSSKVSTDSDAEVNFGGVFRRLELVFDHGCYWSRKDRADFRHTKFEKIRDSGSMILGVSVSDIKGFVYEANSPLSPEVIYAENHAPWGGKPVYYIPNMRKVLVPLGELADAVKITLSSLKREEVVA